MALLALTLALLAMTVATTAITVPLDMALDSFDDQYQGCGPSMEAELPTLNHSEFQNNPHFAKLWTITRDMWWSRGSPVSPLLSPDQAIAVMACTMLYQGDQFNEEVRVAGRSRQAYRDNFHFKTLHFLLTDALATLRAAQGQKCHLVFWGMDYIRYEAKPGDIVRFGEFLSSSLSKSVAEELGNTTMFQVQTCHGVDIKTFGELPEADEVLIPPYEKFKVTKVIEDGEKVEIHLDSIGTYSKYNCEWLTGETVPSGPCLLGVLLLATTALTVATRILSATKPPRLPGSHWPPQSPIPPGPPEKRDHQDYRGHHCHYGYLGHYDLHVVTAASTGTVNTAANTTPLATMVT